MMETLKSYVFLATWIGALAGLFGLVYNMLRNRQTRDGARARLYWPWVLVFIGATAVAWGPTVLLYLRPVPAMQGQSDTTAQSSNQLAREVNSLRSQLRDANRKIDQLQKKLDLASRELETASAEETRTTDQLHRFCKSGLLNQLVTAAVNEGIAQNNLAPLWGQTCVTAACYKNFAEVQNEYISAAQLTKTRRDQVSDALLEEAGAGCAWPQL